MRGSQGAQMFNFRRSLFVARSEGGGKLVARHMAGAEPLEGQRHFRLYSGKGNRRMSENVLVISNADIGDETFGSDKGCWNVTRAMRDCVAGKHKIYEVTVSDIYEANAAVEVDEEKVSSMVADPKRLMPDKVQFVKGKGYEALKSFFPAMSGGGNGKALAANKGKKPSTAKPQAEQVEA